MVTIEDLREQLRVTVRMRESMGVRVPQDARFLGNEDLVLQFGREFPEFRGPRRQMTPRACFANAYQIASRSKGRWIYCEGYATIQNIGIATQHAWVTPADHPGEAHDRTWMNASAGTLYLGIPFQMEFVRKVRAHPKTRMMQEFCILDCWWLRWPLLTGEYKIEDVIWKPE
jgi:hypothetical protein